ncbi:hypothetical protein IC582_013341 [Cucumis melo]
MNHVLQHILHPNPTSYSSGINDGTTTGTTCIQHKQEHTSTSTGQKPSKCGFKTMNKHCQRIWFIDIYFEQASSRNAPNLHL